MNIFNENYFNRRNWILENLENLHVNAKEALVLLLIDYYNEIHVMITHEIIADKLKMEVDEVEEIFLSLSDNGYLTIDMDGGNLFFNIEGVYQKDVKGVPLSPSLIETFEYEFKRPLSPFEMQRIIDMASNYDERRVICALNEAVVYDKVDLNYIEKILISWANKGLSIEDIEKGKR
ncbi:DnaD domain-containing protein [Floccifex sp.]|uniref:DnaD domain-containing protein n=1 Tax=Floccifex sp. TaxID=2815810 RepID=UPI002A7558E4|nr:DnaD domain protein [Floccifex sp.]MDD7282269.1 DnaD domain protein [Erysipelotrichaceae bacterium]MDY2958217.1 DnaD domain protein [Floccifex sp.]